MDNSILKAGFGIVISTALTIAILEACAQNCLKQSQMNNWKLGFYVGIGLYVVVGYLLFHAYKNIGLGKMQLIWSCISIITALVVGHILYEEPFNEYSFVSVILATAAIYVSHLGDEALKSKS